MIKKFNNTHKKHKKLKKSKIGFNMTDTIDAMDSASDGMSYRCY